jgi:hypothetical protein
MSNVVQRACSRTQWVSAGGMVEASMCDLIPPAANHTCKYHSG